MIDHLKSLFLGLGLLALLFAGAAAFAFAVLWLTVNEWVLPAVAVVFVLAFGYAIGKEVRSQRW